MKTSIKKGCELIVDDEKYYFEPESGGIYHSSELMRDILDLAGEMDRDTLSHTLSTKYDSRCVESSIRLLEKEGVIGRPGNAAVTPMSDSLGTKELYLQVSHQCNLRCTYCYADGGHFGGPGMLMDESIAIKAVDFLFDVAAPNDTCSLNFDGGEPFLNFELVRRMVDYSRQESDRRKRKLLLNISSNGTLLTEEKVNYLKSNRISLGLSIDGDRATHDLTRLTPNGQGSYDLFLSATNDSSLFRQLPFAQARGTITADSLHCLSTTQHLMDLGFKIIYLEPVGGQNTTGAIDPQHLEILEDEFSSIADLYTRELANGNLLILRNFFRPLEKIHSRGQFGYRCSAGVHTFAVSPVGDIYPCYKFVGMNDYIMGNINDGNLDQSIANIFRTNHVSRKKKCRQCWARFLCGGGCPYLGASSHGSISAIDDIDCRFTKILCRQALEIYIKLSRKNPKILDSLLGPKSDLY